MDLQFQSTLLQEERLIAYAKKLMDLQFQSTLLQEERLYLFGDVGFLARISIHAPTRGATYTKSAKAMDCQYFNPRSYKRSDTAAFGSWTNVFLFQSTLLQEERRVYIAKRFCQLQISIHAPTRGATHGTTCHLLYMSISIHAPTRGATFCTSTCDVAILFQSTLLQEERRSGLEVEITH